MFLLKLLSLFCLLTGMQQVQAGILFEPYVGYTMGNYKVTGAATHPDVSQQNLTTSGSVDGFSYGGRLGWIYGSFFVSGEYQAARAQLKLDGANESTNWMNTSIFGILGIEFAMGLRAFAGMTVVPHESEISTVPERSKYIGSAKKVGIGYRYRVPFALNAEYVMYEFEEFQIGTLKGKSKERFNKFDYSAVILSISFPFEI